MQRGPTKRRRGGNEALFLPLEAIGASWSSAKVMPTAKMPYNTEDPYYYSIYSQHYKDGSLSDYWVYPFTHIVEGVFSAASAGVVWLLAMVLFSYFLLTGMWTAFLSIDPIKSVIDEGDLTTAIGVLGFIIALITRQEISARIDGVITPLVKYHTMAQRVRTLQENMFAIFRAKIIQFERILRSFGSAHAIDAEERVILQEWLEVMFNTGMDAVTNMQLISLWFLRVFLKGDDVVNDYTSFGITESEIAYSREIPERLYGYVQEDKPLVILRALLRRQKEQVEAASEPLNVTPYGQNVITPSLRDAQSTLIYKSLANLEDALNEVERVTEVNPPRILDTSKIMVLVIYLVGFVPLQIFVDVGALGLLFTPIILMLYSFTLILTWYVGSPFDAHPHWSGGFIYEVRRSLYRTIYADQERFKKWIQRADDIMYAVGTESEVDDLSIVRRRMLKMSSIGDVESSSTDRGRGGAPPRPRFR